MHEYTGTVATNMDTGTIYLLILLSILDLILLNVDTKYSINKRYSYRYWDTDTAKAVSCPGSSHLKLNLPSRSVMSYKFNILRTYNEYSFSFSLLASRNNLTAQCIGEY